MESKEEVTNATPVWAKLLFYVLPPLFLLAIILWFAAGFTPRPTASATPAVVDSAGVLSQSAINELTNIHFPQDTPVVIRTVSKIPMAEIGSYATKTMTSDRHWQALRPRGFLRRFFRSDRPSATGVYVLVSLEPLLLQIRYGDELRLRTYRTGLAAGPWYLEQQRFPREQIESHTVEVVRTVAQRLGDASRPSWLATFLERIPSDAYADVEDLLAPSDSQLKQTTFRSYVRVLSYLGGTKSTFRFFVANIFCLLLPWLVLTKFVAWVLTEARSNKVAIAITHAVTYSGLLGIATLSVTAVGILSHGRIEDEMALSNLGLGALGHIGFNAQTYARAGGLLIAIPACILKFIVDVMKGMFEENTLTLSLECLVWAGVLYLLPLAIGVYALALLVWQFGRIFVNFGKQTTSTDAEASPG